MDPVWTRGALDYQQARVATLRSKALLPSSLSPHPRDQIALRASQSDDPAEWAAIDVFESAWLRHSQGHLTDAAFEALLWEAFLWNTATGSPYRAPPPLSTFDVLTRDPIKGVPLLQLVVGFLRLDLIRAWSQRGLLGEAERGALGFFLDRPRLGKPTAAEEEIAFLLGRTIRPRLPQSLAEARDAVAADALAALTTQADATAAATGR